MKLAIATLAAAAALAAVHARPMHAGIDYQRYLQEKDNITSELDEWLSKYEEIGLDNGWIPASEARSADEVAEDRKQRFFMSKQLLSKLESEQPDAQFTTDTPFSLLTEDEFATYVKNSFLAGGGSTLRGSRGDDEDSEDAPANEEATVEDEDVEEAANAAAKLADTQGASASPLAGMDMSSFLKNLDFSALKSLVGSLFKGSKKEETRRLQTSKDWASNACNAPPMQQGSCGSCWAVATVGAVETAQCLSRGGSVVKYSVQQLTSCDRTNGGCQGGTIGAALRFIQQTGLCTDAAYPYTSAAGRAPTCSTSCSKTQVGMKGITRVTGETGLVTALNKQPVVIAVHAGNSVWKQYKSGVVASCPNARVDHAVIAIGYDANSIKIKNSWGTNWGESGYVRLKRGASTCGMLTDMSYPQI